MGSSIPPITCCGSTTYLLSVHCKSAIVSQLTKPMRYLQPKSLNFNTKTFQIPIIFIFQNLQLMSTSLIKIIRNFVKSHLHVSNFKQKCTNSSIINFQNQLKWGKNTQLENHCDNERRSSFTTRDESIRTPTT